MTSLHRLREKYILLVLVFVCTLLLTGLYWNLRTHIYFDDGFEFAQIGRNIIEGKGISINSYPLPGLLILQENNLLDYPWPVLHKSPFMGIAMSVAMSIFGTYDWVISLSSSFFYILLIPVVYIFARRVLEFDIPSSIVSTLVIMTNGILAEGAIFGMSEPAAVFFFLTFLFFVRKKQHQYAYYLAGIIAGLAYLNRIESLIWIIIIVGLLFFRRFPKKDLQKLIMSFLVIVLPYWIYNFSKTGNPFFSLQSFIVLVAGTSSFAYYPYAESLYINPIIFI
ncbi:MAG TPA: glycosyltransferase family 39 protein, partial [Candidatus Babeliales bacterium]|nr:glycosyltransferase family 39 protein [Candidatus Babeliales bacterium]